LQFIATGFKKLVREEIEKFPISLENFAEVLREIVVCTPEICGC
jgi:hypothetical protein